MQADLEEKPLLEDERNETPLEAQRVPQGQPETRQESETLNTFHAALEYLLSTPDTPPEADAVSRGKDLSCFLSD